MKRLNVQVFWAWLHSLDRSAWLTIGSVIFLFSFAVGITLIAPQYIDSTWTTPASSFQAQMYEVADPHVYLSQATQGGQEVQYVSHIQEGFSLLAFQETETLSIVAPPELEAFVTRRGDPHLKLTSRLLLLRPKNSSFSMEKTDLISSTHQEEWELYDPKQTEAFIWQAGGEFTHAWAAERYQILDSPLKQVYHQSNGVLYQLNPREFRMHFVKTASRAGWQYDPYGTPIASLEQLKAAPLSFHSRKELISRGEKLFATEGCWYCHTDQTRTLIQDLVLNGSDSYPAPPSSSHEYTYQEITFAGTRRIGPDLSRVGVKRPFRDWHKGHFWSPKTASQGSIMPAFRHFFDDDPRGTAKHLTGVPNLLFEAMYQYLMTKGTRITPPNQAWWLGKDPVQTKDLIEGKPGWWSHKTQPAS